LIEKRVDRRPLKGRKSIENM